MHSMTGAARLRVLGGILAAAACWWGGGLAAPAAEAPSWQIGDEWRVRRNFDLDLVVDDASIGSMAIQEEYDLTVMEALVFEGELAYRLERSNDSVTGSGMATIPDMGTFNLNLGPNSSTEGEEYVRAGDYASMRDSFTTFLQIRTQVIFQVTIANATLQLNTVSDPPLELLDFPLDAGNEWTSASQQHATGSLMVDFVGLLEDQFDDIDRPIDRQIPVALQWVAAAGSGDLIELSQEIAGATATYDPSFERPRLLNLPSTDEEVQSVREEVLSATLQADPAFDFAVEFDAGGAVQLEGSGAPVDAAIEIYLTGSDIAPIATVIADSQGNFSASFAGPEGNDGSPSNDDEGSFGVAAREPVSGDIRAYSLVRPLEGPSAASGWLAY
jgi:hypothetical protein